MSDTRQTYSEETRAAVMAALLSGQSLSKVAKEYKIPKSTVANWSADARRYGTVPNQKRERVGELLVAYLEASLETLHKQVGLFADEGWLFKQPASEAAVLHGVIADKAIRLLEAFAEDPDEDEAEDDEEGGA